MSLPGEKEAATQLANAIRQAFINTLELAHTRLLAAPVLKDRWMTKVLSTFVNRGNPTTVTSVEEAMEFAKMAEVMRRAGSLTREEIVFNMEQTPSCSTCQGHGVVNETRPERCTKCSTKTRSVA
jgi:hypothetical protein